MRKSEIKNTIISIKGRRKTNEDSAEIKIFEVNRKPVVIVAVADGMGGYSGGKISSEKAVKIFCEEMEKVIQESTQFKDIRIAIREVYQQINKEIYRISQTNEDLKNMGTTLTTMVMVGDEFLIANVGDSRAYALREENIVQITEDHNAITDALKEGYLSYQELKNYPYKYALTRNLGDENEVEVDIFPEEGCYRASPGLIITLLTDGITSKVTELEIYERLISNENLNKASEEIVSLALAKGSDDNITIAAVEVGEIRRNEALVKKGKPGKKGRKRKFILFSGIFILVIILMVLIFILK